MASSASQHDRLDFVDSIEIGIAGVERVALVVPDGRCELGRVHGRTFVGEFVRQSALAALSTHECRTLPWDRELPRHDTDADLAADLEYAR